jgi:predicted esterase
MLDAHFAPLDPADLMQPDYLEAEPWATLIGENNPGNVVSEAPIFVYHSTQDELIPVALSGIMLDRMCDNGQVVERVTPDTGGHAPAAPPAYQAAFEWVEARFDGEPVTPSCPDG